MNYGELQATIADELSRTDLTEQIKRAILSSIRYYEKKPIWFLQHHGEFTTAKDGEQYPLPGGDRFISLEWLRLDQDGIDYSLTPIRFREHEATTRNPRWPGEPRWYAIWNGCIYLSPRPDKAYRLVAAYYRGEPQFLHFPDDQAREAAQTNEWTKTGFDLIVASACRYLAGRVIRDREEEGYWLAEEARHYAMLTDHHAEHQPSNRLGLFEL